MDPEKREGAIEALKRFYRDLDRAVDGLLALHGPRIRCGKGCSGCCLDGLTVFQVEAEHIVLHNADLLNQGHPQPEGACAFLDHEGNCRIYAHRPYVCRTQGLPLRWTDALPDGVQVEMRDICPINEPGPPVETLPAEACWLIGPFESRLREMQDAFGTVRGLRVSLRGLFRKVSAAP